MTSEQFWTGLMCPLFQSNLQSQNVTRYEVWLTCTELDCQDLARQIIETRELPDACAKPPLRGDIEATRCEKTERIEPIKVHFRFD